MTNQAPKTSKGGVETVYGYLKRMGVKIPADATVMQLFHLFHTTRMKELQSGTK